MKTMMLSACCLFACLESFAVRLTLNNLENELELVNTLAETGLDDTQQRKVLAAYQDYKEAESMLQEILELNGLNKPKPNDNPINADLVDPTIRRIQRQAQKYHARFEVLKRTQNKWGPSTNLLARAARQSMQQRLDETRAERDAAKEFEKQVKELQKAAKKDGKSLNKLRKDIEKYRDKAETDGFRETCERLLDILPTTN